jgi:hypothetical protein
MRAATGGNPMCLEIHEVLHGNRRARKRPVAEKAPALAEDVKRWWMPWSPRH